jgi:hypothetical protein
MYLIYSLLTLFDNKLFLFSNILYKMYKEKYIKYKTKYLDLKNQLGGASYTIKNRGVLPNFNLFAPSEKQKAAAAAKKAAAAAEKKAAAEKAAAEKEAAAEKAAAEKEAAAEKAAAEEEAAAKKAAAEEEEAELVAAIKIYDERVAAKNAAAEKAVAEINDIIKSSKTCANAYKDRKSKSHILHFYFYINNWHTESKIIDGQHKKSENKNNIITFEQYFTYDNMNIYMSNEKNSPVKYNEHFRLMGYGRNIGYFFKRFIELLISIDELKKNMDLLDVDNAHHFLRYFVVISGHFKPLFNIYLNEHDIIRNYNKYNLPKDKNVTQTYTCGYQFFINGKEINVNTTDIKTYLGLDDTVESMAIENFTKYKAHVQSYLPKRK